MIFSGFCIGSAQTAELTPVVQAFSDAEKYKLSKIKIITDSIYVHDGVAKNLLEWNSRNFTVQNGKELAHKHLCILVAEFMRKTKVQIAHVKSHTDNQDPDYLGNAQADKISQMRGIFSPKLLMDACDIETNRELVKYIHEEF